MHEEVKDRRRMTSQHVKNERKTEMTIKQARTGSRQAIPKKPSVTKMPNSNMYTDIITDLAEREKYPGELGGAKFKTTKASTNRAAIKGSLLQKPRKNNPKASPSKGNSKWIGQVRL